MSDLADQALAAFQQNQLAEAARLAREALDADPSDADAKGALGLTRARQQDVREAPQLLTEAIEGGSSIKELPAALVFAYGRLHGPDALMAHLARLLERQPLNTDLRTSLAQLFYRHGKYDEEAALCAAGIGAGDKSPELLIYLGRGLFAAGRSEEAVQALELFVVADPKEAEGHYLLGEALSSLGRIDEAREAYLAAMRERPFHPAAFASYARSGRMTPDDPIVPKLDQLEDLLRTADDETASFYLYGRGKIFEDLERYEEAWADYTQGGARLARKERYLPKEMELELEATKALFTKGTIEELAGRSKTGARPIFIVGMLRSGSTLIEQILSRHPDVSALGELPDLDQALRRFIGGGVHGGWGKVGPDYLERVATLANGWDRRTVDKGLHNFLWVGAIHALFPNAVILHTVRDPLDTCVSCFSLRFTKGHPWSNRVSDLAHYYRSYREMMAHWDEVLPGRVVNVTYEELVTDFEPQVRRLLEACGLDWNPACLEFEASERAVRTASAVQVRQGINTASIGRWKRFEPCLGELKQALQDYL